MVAVIPVMVAMLTVFASAVHSQPSVKVSVILVVAHIRVHAGDGTVMLEEMGDMTPVLVSIVRSLQLMQRMCMLLSIGAIRRKIIRELSFQ